MVATARHRARVRLIGECRPRRVLGHREFAEKYVRMGSGPYKGQPFRVSRQPITGLLLDELDDPHWDEAYITGPSQSSKSLCGFVIPTLRDVAELRLDTLVGTPEADMMSDKWDKDFLPVFQQSPQLEPLLPTSGPGAKGGRIKDRVSLTNGTDIKIMTRGGQDTNKAGFSSPRLRLTEAAGWSKKSEPSVEGGPFRQVKARLRGYKRSDPRRILTVEGTLTIDEELPMSARGEDDDELLISTRSVIQSPCPHCVRFIAPGREFLVGWQDAENEQQVKEFATWICPLCSCTISDEERAVSLADCRLVHWGQHVNEHGEVVGDRPPTSTLWFAWGAWHNRLLDAADVAMDEWEASHLEEGTQEHEDAERALCQFVHGVTFKSTLAAHEPLQAKVVRSRFDRELPRSLLPADTLKLTMGVDIGDWTGWWFMIAWRACGLLHVPAYGAFDIKRNKSDDLSTRIVAALHDLADSTVEPGFPIEGGSEPMTPDEVWIDGGYMPDDVADFVRDREGRYWDKRYKLARGRGLSTNNGGYNHPPGVSPTYPKVGTQWYAKPNYVRKIPEYTFNADYWKLYVDRRLRAEPGKKGALTFYRADHKNEHAKVSNHLCNEQFKKEWVPEKGLVEHWVKTGDQHHKDGAAMACAAGDSVGFSLKLIAEREEPTIVVPDTPTEAPDGTFYARMMALACN